MQPRSRPSVVRVTKLAPGASAPATLRAVDQILAPYGGLPAYGREDQVSHAFLEAELDELDRVANQIAVPLAHADELYALRNNIEKVRRRLLAKRSKR